ncbi:MAG: phospholipid carrier-dependent glycosyltransferase [Moorea sp. SIO2B7]|nr:phospholipid carrier-dependent glycosyltransferase [Moorena sp. SIO2B7]
MLQTNKLRDNSGIYLLIIVAIAAILRLLFLGTIPNGFFTDEASNAYDAYSIGETLRDQYGEFLPLFAKSANSYPESLYIFISVPFIKIFGLNEFGARFPAALIGILTIPILYYLAKEFFNQRVALIAALFLAISPWHIQFSRIAFRAIIFPLLFCISLIFFLKSLRQTKYLPLSGLLFGISIYTYNSARVFVPFFFLGLGIIFWQHLWENRVKTLIAFVLFLIILIPLLIFSISPEGMARANEVGIEKNPFTIIQYYLSYFSPNFLFFEGDPISRHSPDDIGELYYFEIITVIFGLFLLFKENSQEKNILLLWLFLYPFPAALISPNSSVRTIIGVPLFAILSAYGTTKLIDLFQDKKKRACIYSAVLIFLASLTIFVKQYFIHYPTWKLIDWLTGMREIITYADKSDYTCLVISQNLYSKYIYILVPFYTQFPPAEYQRLGIDVVTDKLDMGRWKIQNFDQQNKLNRNCLYIFKKEEIEALAAKGYNWKEVHIVKDINGDQHYKLVEVNSVN